MYIGVIGKRIILIRKNKAHLSQEEFSIKLGFGRIYILRNESGKKKITLNNLVKICKRLEVSPKEFFDFEEDRL